MACKYAMFALDNLVFAWDFMWVMVDPEINELGGLSVDVQDDANPMLLMSLPVSALWSKSKLSCKLWSSSAVQWE